MNEGIIYCLLTSLLWALSSLFATAPIRALGPQVYNCLRLVLGSFFLWIIFLFSQKWQQPSLNEAALVCASALIGLSIGDMLLFKGFAILGARRSTLIFMLNVPITSFIGFVLFNEALSHQEILGGSIALCGIGLATYAGRNQKGGRTQVDEVHGAIWKGFAFCTLAAVCQSVGLLSLKPVLNSGEFSAVQMAAMRFSIAAIASLLLTRQIIEMKRFTLSLRATEPRVLLSALFSIMTGGVLGFVLYIEGISKVPASYAALLTSLSPLFVLPLLVIYNRRSPTMLSWLGAILGLGGIYLCLSH